MKKSIFLFFAAILCAMNVNAWSLMGEVTDWSSGKEMTGDANVVSCTVTLQASKTLKLKIKDGNTWYGNNGTMTSSNNLAWGFSSSDGDAKITTKDAGDYTFTWYIKDKKLSVTYPNHNYIIAGDGAVMEDDWSPSSTKNKMEKQDDGTYRLIKTNRSLSVNTYGYKLTVGSWSVNQYPNDNVALKVTTAGNYNVVFTYNPKNGQLSHELVPIYTITASANPATAGVVTGAGTYAKDASVTLGATPNAGYKFVNWTVGGEEKSTETTYSFTASANVTAVANFELSDPEVPTYAISVSANDDAMGTVTGAGDYTEGSLVTLTATPNAGYRFVNWTVGSEVKSTEATYSFTASEALTIVANFEAIPKYDITVKAVVPEAWTSATIGIHYWGDGISGTSTPVATEKEGNWNKYTIKDVLEGQSVNVIFLNGTSWTDDKSKQTANITGITEDKCFQISAKTLDGEGKCTFTEVDCAADIKPETDIYTIVGSSAELGLEWDPAKEANDMEKQGDGSYKKVYSNVELTSDVEWKIAKNDNWWNETPLENKADNGNSVLVIAKSGIYNVTFTLSADLETAHAEAELLEETNTVADCFISGNAALTGGAGWAGNEFKMEYDPATETYSYTLTGLAASTAYELQVVLGGNWYGYDKLQTIPTGVENKEGHIAFTLAEAGNVTVTYHATNGIGLTGNFALPVTYDYYIAGTLAGGWSATQQGMEKDGDLYKHTFSALPAGTFEFKITDGQFNSEGDNTHEHTTLGAAYEEVSYNEGNIKIVTDEAINLTVIFDATEDEITFEGLTETTPAKCYLMGIGGDWTTGIEMEEDGDQFKLLCQPIAEGEQFKFKYGDTWTTDVENYDANGVGWVETSPGSGQYNITLPAGNYNFYYKKNENKVWIEAATDCAPATATITLVDAQEYGATLTLSADEYVVGDEITASAAIYDDGFAFAYWKENGEIVSYNADYTFVVTGDRTLEAYFGGNMPVEMADLAVDGDAMTITGSNTTDGVTASLKLDNYDSDTEMWSVDATNSTLEWRSPMDGTPLNLTVLYGEVWLDMEAYSMAMAKVVADFGGELYVFNLTMTAASETLEVGVATELSLEFGALVMRGTWYADKEDEVGYPFTATIGGFDYTVAEAEYRVSVELGEWNDDDDSRWLGFGESVMSVAIEDGKVILVGTVTTNYPINTLNVVAQGNIQILPMDIDVTVEEMDMGDAVYLKLNGTDYESGIDIELYLNDYTGADKTYELNEASSIAGGAAQATGSLTKSGNTYTGVAYASAMGALYVLELKLTEFVPEYENIVVTGLTGAAEARYMGWGDEYYLALSLEGTWSDGVVTYPVSIQLADYDPAVTSGTTYVSLTIGGMEDDQEWLGSIDGGEMNFSISGKTITLTGKLDNAYNWPAPIYWDLTITGTILPNYTRDVTLSEDGYRYGTICLPFGGTVEGAELYELVKAETDGVLLGSVNKLEAGVPYIFKATASQLAVYCDATVADEAGASNGLHGTFDDDTEVAAGNYIVYENELCEVVSDVKVNANRAYLVMSEVPTSHTQMPGRRYIGMGVHGENGTTGLDNIMTTDAPVKAIENGQLIIIRNGEKYNVQGVRL